MRELLQRWLPPYATVVIIFSIANVIHALRNHSSTMLIDILRVLCGFPKDSMTAPVVDDLHPYVEVLVMIFDASMQGRQRQTFLREAYGAS